jgi:hypothetical protein
MRLCCCCRSGFAEGRRPTRRRPIGKLIERTPSHLDFDLTTVPLSPRIATSTLSALHSPHPSFPLCVSPTCCRQRGLPPQWPCEVRPCCPNNCPRPRANSATSQTVDGPATLPRRKHCLHIVYLVQQCDPRTAEPGSGRRCPGDATADEAGAARSAIAKSGGEEGSYAICLVRGSSPYCVFSQIGGFREV